MASTNPSARLELAEEWILSNIWCAGTWVVNLLKSEYSHMAAMSEDKAVRYAD